MPSFHNGGVGGGKEDHQWFSTGICARTSVVKHLYVTLKREANMVTKLRTKIIQGSKRKKQSAKSCKGYSDTVFLDNKMVDDVNKCRMMHT